MDSSKKVTISQIATHAQVSVATVSRLINKTGYVKPDTRQKIMDAMDALHYHQKNTDSFINTNSLLVCLPDFENPFNNDIISGIQSVALNRGYRPFYYEARDFRDALADYEDILKKNHFSGILLVHNVVDVELLDDLRLRYPVVMCSEHCDRSAVSYVSIDDNAAAQTAINYLITIGRTKIAFLNSMLTNNYAKHREKGVMSALKHAGLSMNLDWITHISGINFDMAVSAAASMLSMKEKPNAFFCISDVFAAAVVKAATNLGLRVPEDVAVIGFDNIPLATMTVPSLTTISQPSFQIGQQACDLLINQIENPSSTIKQVILNTELIVRDSTNIFRTVPNSELPHTI